MALSCDEVIASSIDLLTTTNGKWIPIPNATITLTEQGIYQVVQQVRGEIEVPGNPFTIAAIVSRLFNVTAESPVSNSDQLVTYGGYVTSDGPALYGGTATGYTCMHIPGGTTIRLEAKLYWVRGTPQRGLIYSEPIAGFTKLSYMQLA